MIRHLLKLVWHRRRANLLVVVEIFACFLVAFPLAGFGLFLWRNSTQPVGYDWRDVWSVVIDVGGDEAAGDGSEAAAATLARLVAAARARPEVLSAAVAQLAPLEMATSERDRDGVSTQADLASDGFAEAMDLEIVAGRWFGPEDDAAAFRPVVVDRDLARTLWGDADAIGRRFPIVLGEGDDERVVGVVAEFKKDGELASPGNFVFYRARLGEVAPPAISRLVLEMAPGADAAVEERLVGELSALAPGWTLEVTPLARLRANQIRTRLVPLVLGGTVALFLLAMVGLGLTGVLWQAITQRRGELGLRRALGASRGQVRTQVLGEVLLLAAVAVGAGTLVVVQLPLFELAGSLDPALFTGALVVAVTTILGLALVCGLYPSRLAMRVEPAEALRSE
ncbi:MAG TPA: FtsX-like permease family protein [Thermoanaerobaculia bacterium]